MKKKYYLKKGLLLYFGLTSLIAITIVALLILNYREEHLVPIIIIACITLLLFLVVFMFGGFSYITFDDLKIEYHSFNKKHILYKDITQIKGDYEPRLIYSGYGGVIYIVKIISQNTSISVPFDLFEKEIKRFIISFNVCFDDSI